MASIPGGPDGLPGPGLPILPVPYPPEPLAAFEPEPDLEPEVPEPDPLDGESCGDGI